MHGFGPNARIYNDLDTVLILGMKAEDKANSQDDDHVTA